MPELEFPNQLNNFLTFCNLRNSAIESKSLDLQLSSWFYPTTLLPLGAFIKEKREQIKYIPPPLPVHNGPNLFGQYFLMTQVLNYW